MLRALHSLQELSMAKCRLGVAGLVHDHVWTELRYWVETGRVDIVAVGDPHEPLRQRARDEFGVEKFFDDPLAMIEECRLDIVEVCTSNADHVAVVEAAAGQGVHCKVEKPMAASLADADRMLAAADSSGIVLLVNWPNRWRPNTIQAWHLVQSGEIGKPFTVRMRMAHCGPRELGCSEYFCDWLYDSSQAGSGALFDYCSYGAAAFSHLLGLPKSVQAVARRLLKQDISVVDNAAIACEYDQCFAFTEASWTQMPHYHDAIYFGDEGTLWTQTDQVLLAKGREGVPVQVTVAPLPADRRNGAELMLWCLDHGEQPPDTCNSRVCRDAQEILEAGLIAAASGVRVYLPVTGAGAKSYTGEQVSGS